MEENPFDKTLFTSDGRDAKRLRNVTALRAIFLVWKSYAKQVKRDKVLFFKVKEFIIRRLRRAAFRSLKLHYLFETLVKHALKKRDKSCLQSCFIGWMQSRALDRKLHSVFSKAFDKLDIARGFAAIDSRAKRNYTKRRKRLLSLKYWAKSLKAKVMRSLILSLENRQ